jgi:hypothetical protein
MTQGDPLELAIAEVERLRRAQNDQLRTAFAEIREGATFSGVDIGTIRQLAECAHFERRHFAAWDHSLVLNHTRC